MKKIIRKLLNKVGYDFVKINMHNDSKAKKIGEIMVGKYLLQMPGNNAQLSLYKYMPYSNSQLGRLAKTVFEKYNNMTLVDVGANVGDTIAIVKSQIDVPIIAIEGDELSFTFLEKNSLLFKHIYLEKTFLGETTSNLKVSIEKEGWNNTILPNNKGTKTLAVKTLDFLLESQELKNQQIKLLKIDTEGFDTIILRGCLKTMQKYKPILYFEYNGENMKAINEDGFKTLMWLKEFGYNNILIYDCKNTLLFKLYLKDEDSLMQLHDYAHKKNTMIPYFDICVFHKDDNELCNTFLQLENNAINNA